MPHRHRPVDETRTRHSKFPKWHWFPIKIVQKYTGGCAAATTQQCRTGRGGKQLPVITAPSSRRESSSEDVQSKLVPQCISIPLDSRGVFALAWENSSTGTVRWPASQAAKFTVLSFSAHISGSQAAKFTVKPQDAT
jgi:hypothetical protein